MLDYEEEDPLEDVVDTYFVAETTSHDITVEVELIENGAQTPVTKENRDLFVKLYIEY